MAGSKRCASAVIPHRATRCDFSQVWGNGGEVGARLCTWVVWFVLEGHVREPLFILMVIYGLLGVINYFRFTRLRDVDLLHRVLRCGVSGIVAAILPVFVDIVRAGLI